jgi:hypothetical protein
MLVCIAVSFGGLLEKSRIRRINETSETSEIIEATDSERGGSRLRYYNTAGAILLRVGA